MGDTANDRTTSKSANTRRSFLFYSLIAAIGFFYLLWPGDAPFVNDEPKLFLSADAANKDHHLAPSGLMGSVGLIYGPSPTWAYQLMLLISNQPQAWVVMHVVLMLTGIVIGLMMVARALNLGRWFILLVLFSPYTWFYARHLWDNSFLIPLSCLTLGSYALHLRFKTTEMEPSTRAIVLAALLSMLLPLIHFMALPLSLALLSHMLLFMRKDLWRARWSLLIGGLLLGATHLSYFSLLVNHIKHFEPHRRSSFISEGWAFPLFGGKIFSGWNLEYFFGPQWLPDSWFFRLPEMLTMLSYASVWFGIFLATKSTVENPLRSDLPKPLLGPEAPLKHLLLVAVMALSLQMIVCGLSSSSHHPHYYNGLWAVYAVFAWIAIDRLTKRRSGVLGVAIYSTSLVSVLISLSILIHHRSGTRGEGYGPTIGNQLQIANLLGREERSDVNQRVENFKRYPSLKTLQKISASSSREALGPCVVEYDSNAPLSARVILRTLASPEPTHPK